MDEKIAYVFASNHAIVYANIRKKNALDNWLNMLPSEIAKNIIPIVLDMRDFLDFVRLYKKSEKSLDI